MRRPVRLGKFLCGAWLLLALVPAAANELQLRIGAVHNDAARLEQVRVSLDWPAGAASGELTLQAARLQVPAMGQDLRSLRWRCPLSLADDGQWRCEGPVDSAGGAGALAVSLSPAQIDAMLSARGSQLDYAWRAGAPDRHQVDLKAVPVAWLKAFLATIWEDGQWSGGRLDGRVSVGTGGAVSVQTDLRLREVGLETPDGWLAAAGMQGRLELDYDGAGPRPRTAVRYTARGGEFLVGSLYVPLPQSAVQVDVELLPGQGGGWEVPRFGWRDGDVLKATGSARLDAGNTLSDLELSLSLDELATARDRYLSGFLAPAGFADLVLAGGVQARLRMADGQWQSMALGLQRLNAIDPRQRFTLAGLHGNLHWQAGGDAEPGQLAWDSAALFGIGLGHARLGFTSDGGQLKLREPVSIAVLQGQLRLDHLRWQPPAGDQGIRFALGATLQDLDLGSLSQRLGWPPFEGSISGRIPSARYQANVLTLDGGLTMQLFDGTVALSSLEMERPFGVAPTLSADVVIEDIDLEPMTAAFGFGSITGRLDGHIQGLRMVDWSPVAFDARLQSDPDWKGRRRISQRAVEDISKVGGGGGLMGGLQAQALRLFDDFRYSRIGLACRLRDNVCLMDGVDSAGDGYTIVQGAGLPRIQVVGFRRRVDWPTLVDRLKAATEGQTPVIQ
ncbi:hypothetical protein [Arenimonas donghaensis]|nr:hypothetical protein [Arenimonas donghaensis]